MAIIDIPLINDFSLCRQTVTHYRLGGETVTRTVHPMAYFEETDAVDIARTGESGKSEHLVVIPGEVDIAPGDKLYLGTGPVPSGDAAAWWRGFIPAKVPACVVVRSVSQRHWLGEPSHVEVRG